MDSAMKKNDGFSLLETMVGLSLLLVVAAGTIPLATVAFATSENQGHLSSRAAEYAQDKLEQLMALAYGDSTSDTRLFPAPDIGGTGLTIGGSSNPAAPVAQYVDYLDVDGALIASPGGAPPAGWFYQRVWQVSTVPAPGGGVRANLKQITVTATVARTQGAWALRPRATVSALKTFPF
jgi:prepilin-type N-terminal cleavage/methylation domain-containing protein